MSVLEVRTLSSKNHATLHKLARLFKVKYAQAYRDVIKGFEDWLDKNEKDIEPIMRINKNLTDEQYLLAKGYRIPQTSLDSEIETLKAEVTSLEDEFDQLYQDATRRGEATRSRYAILALKYDYNFSQVARDVDVSRQQVSLILGKQDEFMTEHSR